MIVNGIQCNACNKIHNMDIVRDKLPQNWLEVKAVNEASMHFCCLLCLISWVREQEKEEPKSEVGSPATSENWRPREGKA